MLDAPRPPSVPILGRRMLIWLVIAGLTMAVVTLGVIAWATPLYGEAVARTMGLTAFSLANIWFAFETAHEEKSIVSAETLANPTLLKTGALAIIATVAASELGLLNRVLDTVNLSTQQWAHLPGPVVGGHRGGGNQEAAAHPDDRDAPAGTGQRGARRRERRVSRQRRRERVGTSKLRGPDVRAGAEGGGRA